MMGKAEPFQLFELATMFGLITSSFYFDHEYSLYLFTYNGKHLLVLAVLFGALFSHSVMVLAFKQMEGLQREVYLFYRLLLSVIILRYSACSSISFAVIGMAGMLVYLFIFANGARNETTRNAFNIIAIALPLVSIAVNQQILGLYLITAAVASALTVKLYFKSHGKSCLAAVCLVFAAVLLDSRCLLIVSFCLFCFLVLFFVFRFSFFKFVCFFVCFCGISF